MPALNTDRLIPTVRQIPPSRVDFGLLAPTGINPQNCAIRLAPSSNSPASSPSAGRLHLARSASRTVSGDSPVGTGRSGIESRKAASWPTRRYPTARNCSELIANRAWRIRFTGTHDCQSRQLAWFDQEMLAAYRSAGSMAHCILTAPGCGLVSPRLPTARAWASRHRKL